jgi:hypothetical protein
MYEELAHTEERDGFTIKLYLCEDDTAIADSFDDSVHDVADLEDKVRRGVYLWFCAKVTASKAGVELGCDYLGACMYESASDFMAEGGYYEDMVSRAIDEARAKLAELAT